MILGQVPQGTGLQLEVHALALGVAVSRPVATLFVPPDKLARAQGINPAGVDASLLVLPTPATVDDEARPGKGKGSGVVERFKGGFWRCVTLHHHCTHSHLHWPPPHLHSWLSTVPSV